jgi:hypothetical protein
MASIFGMHPATSAAREFEMGGQTQEEWQKMPYTSPELKDTRPIINGLGPVVSNLKGNNRKIVMKGLYDNVGMNQFHINPLVRFLEELQGNLRKDLTRRNLGTFQAAVADIGSTKPMVSTFILPCTLGAQEKHPFTDSGSWFNHM